MGKPSSFDVDFVTNNNSSKLKWAGNSNFQNWIFGFILVILPLLIIALLKSIALQQDWLCKIVNFFDEFFSDYELLYISVTLILPAMFEMYTTKPSVRGSALLFNFLFLDLVFCSVLYGIIKWNTEIENSANISVKFINAFVIVLTFFLGCAAFIKGGQKGS